MISIYLVMTVYCATMAHYAARITDSRVTDRALRRWDWATRTWVVLALAYYTLLVLRLVRLEVLS